MLQAAIPVEAVTATTSGLEEYLRRRLAMISRSKTDFPVPVEGEGEREVDVSPLSGYQSRMYARKFRDLRFIKWICRSSVSPRRDRRKRNHCERLTFHPLSLRCSPLSSI